MEQRQSVSCYFQLNPPNPREIERLLNGIRDGRMVAPEDTKHPPTCAEICLPVSLVATIASVRDRAQFSSNVDRQTLIDAGSRLMRMPIDWDRCPVDYDFNNLLGTLEALGTEPGTEDRGLLREEVQPRGRLNPYSDLHAEWLELEKAGFPLFKIGCESDGSFSVTNERVPPPKR